MYFTTFNHYDDDNIDIYNNITDYNIMETCLICWDPSTTNNKISKMKQLMSSSIYYTHCSCNAYFHKDCLFQWINKTNSCPICRFEFDFNINETYPFTFNIFSIFKLICKLCFQYFLLRILYNIIFGIHFAVEKKIQEEQCELL